MRRVDLDIYCAICAEKLSFVFVDMETDDDGVRCQLEIDPHECCEDEEE